MMSSPKIIEFVGICDPTSEKEADVIQSAPSQVIIIFCSCYGQKDWKITKISGLKRQVNVSTSKRHSNHAEHAYIGSKPVANVILSRSYFNTPNLNKEPEIH